MSLARNVATVGSATLFSRVLGFARDIGIAAVFGAGIRADAFFVVFQLANLIRRMLAEGALNAAVVPLYLRARDEGGEQAARAFAGRLIGTFALALSGAVVVFAVAMPAIVLALAPGFVFGGPRMTSAVEFARLMLPYLALAGPVAVLMGVLNANGRFAAAAYATTAFNATMLAALLVVFAIHGGDSQPSGRILAFGVALAGVSQLALVAIAVRLGPARVTPLSVSFGPEVRRFLTLAIPGLLASGIPQITVIAGVMVASASRSAVSWIYYANRLIELPLGIVGIAVGTVLVPAFAHAIRSGDKRELAQVESRGIELALGLALPAAIALVSLAEPIVRVLFERGAFAAGDTAATAAALCRLRARPARPRAGQDIFAGVLCPRRHRHADARSLVRLRHRHHRQSRADAGVRPCRRRHRHRRVRLGERRPTGRTDRAAHRLRHRCASAFPAAAYRAGRRHHGAFGRGRPSHARSPGSARPRKAPSVRPCWRP